MQIFLHIFAQIKEKSAVFPPNGKFCSPNHGVQTQKKKAEAFF
jgi:hypothetical protein